MPILNIKSEQFYYQIHGEGEVVVLAHGMGGNHATWYKQVSVLAKAYKVITFDHRGFGLSTDNEQSGRAGFVSDLLALLDHLNIEKAALVGQSMGGGTVINFAHQYPQRVSGLVICDSLHGLVESNDIAEIMDKARLETKGLSQLERVLGLSFQTKQPEQALLYQQINSFNKTDKSNLSGNYADEKVSAEQLANLNVPIMFVSGQDDILFPIEAVRLMQEQVIGSFIVEFDNCGHSAFFEKPEEFNDSILSFLQMAGLNPSQSVHSNASGYVAQ
ncbi:alpha/beta fold hydrolase [Thalassotalea crassostreae]|uniref:alpha/beta fold hydrolase n=1 Tax=Thalassotalea crassostreae TaxID=1763536 RepID=UPI000837B049|nr:alpha/beta hydrolase [Thalassotalea crassostreae]